jgi:hypothetical protein
MFGYSIGRGCRTRNVGDCGVGMPVQGDRHGTRLCNQFRQVLRRPHLIRSPINNYDRACDLLISPSIPCFHAYCRLVAVMQVIHMTHKSVGCASSAPDSL